MAGFSSDWGEGLHFDVGYRLLGLGNAATGDLVREDSGACSAGPRGRQHVGTPGAFGFRYDIY